MLTLMAKGWDFYNTELDTIFPSARFIVENEQSDMFLCGCLAFSVLCCTLGPYI